MTDTPEIISRKSAKALGLRHYYTGKPCKRGHVSERRSDNGDCLCCRPIQFSNWVEGSEDGDRGRSLKYYYDNIDKCRKKSLEYYRVNKEDRKEYKSGWLKRNQHYSRSAMAKRRARKRSAGGSYTKSDIDKMLTDQRNKCAESTCRIDLSDGYHVDHIMPISRGGSNYPENLQCLCPECNLRKHAKHPIDWAQENGRLL